MKKLFFAAVLSLGSLTAFAQEAEETQDPQNETSVETSVEMEAEAGAQDDYSEVAIEELPEAVSAAVATNYPTATIDKAYVNGENQFKLEVSLQDGTAGTLYADEEGNWIEE